MPGYDGYEADADGVIYGRRGRPLSASCPYRPGFSNYPRVGIVKERPDGTKYGGYGNVHVMVCLAFHGPRPTPEHQASHLNGDTGDNRASNLAWETPVENMARAKEHGTLRMGEAHGMARLTAADVEAIRASGEPLSVLGKRYGVNPNTIGHVRHGRSWRG